MVARVTAGLAESSGSLFLVYFVFRIMSCVSLVPVPVHCSRLMSNNKGLLTSLHTCFEANAWTVD